MKLEMIDDANFEEFLSAPLSFLMIGKVGCGPCMEWTAELESSGESFPLVRFGKITVGGENKLTNFKRAHGTWLIRVREMPYNSLWVNGKIVKEWPGGGMDRLINRLKNLSE